MASEGRLDGSSDCIQEVAQRPAVWTSLRDRISHAPALQGHGVRIERFDMARHGLAAYQALVTKSDRLWEFRRSTKPDSYEAFKRRMLGTRTNGPYVNFAVVDTSLSQESFAGVLFFTLIDDRSRSVEIGLEIVDHLTGTHVTCEVARLLPEWFFGPQGLGLCRASASTATVNTRANAALQKLSFSAYEYCARSASVGHPCKKEIGRTVPSDPLYGCPQAGQEIDLSYYSMTVFDWLNSKTVSSEEQTAGRAHHSAQPARIASAPRTWTQEELQAIEAAEVAQEECRRGFASKPTLIASGVRLEPFDLDRHGLEAFRVTATEATAANKYRMTSVQGWEDWSATHKARSESRKCALFAVFNTAGEDEIVGVYLIHHFNARSRSAELGRRLADRALRSHVNSQATMLLLDWLFGDLKLRRLVLRTAKENMLARSSASRSGFIEEGVERAAMLTNNALVGVEAPPSCATEKYGRVADLHVYSLTWSDWRDGVHERVAKMADRPPCILPPA